MVKFVFFFFKDFYFYLWVYVFVCTGCVHILQRTQRVLDALDLNLRAVVSHQNWVLAPRVSTTHSWLLSHLSVPQMLDPNGYILTSTICESAHSLLWWFPPSSHKHRNNTKVRHLKVHGSLGEIAKDSFCGTSILRKLHLRLSRCHSVYILGRPLGWEVNIKNVFPWQFLQSQHTMKTKAIVYLQTDESQEESVSPWSRTLLPLAGNPPAWPLTRPACAVFFCKEQRTNTQKGDVFISKDPSILETQK